MYSKMKIRKINWKVLIALIVLVGASIWGVDSLRTRSYSGSNLTFGVGSGPVTVTNLSDAPLPVKLIGARPATFSVTSGIEGVTGRSISQGNGRNATQLFEFALPPGVSEFTVIRSADVSFVASGDTRLEAAVQPLNAQDSQTTLLVAVIAIIASLFYLSSVNGHRWISASRRRKASDQAAAKETENQTFKRMFGRVTSDKS